MEANSNNEKNTTTAETPLGQMKVPKMPQMPKFEMPNFNTTLEDETPDIPANDNVVSNTANTSSEPESVNNDMKDNTVGYNNYGIDPNANVTSPAESKVYVNVKEKEKMYPRREHVSLRDNFDYRDDVGRENMLREIKFYNAQENELDDVIYSINKAQSRSRRYERQRTIFNFSLIMLLRDAIANPEINSNQREADLLKDLVEKMTYHLSEDCQTPIDDVAKMIKERGVEERLISQQDLMRYINEK